MSQSLLELAATTRLGNLPFVSETKFRKWRSPADRDAVAMAVPCAVPSAGSGREIVLRVVEEGMVKAVSRLN